MLDTPCSEVVWRVLAIHSIRQFPLHFSSSASPWAITFQLDSNTPVLVNAVEYVNVLRNNAHDASKTAAISAFKWAVFILLGTKEGKKFGRTSNLVLTIWRLTATLVVVPHR
jgi:hypothetical protein